MDRGKKNNKYSSDTYKGVNKGYNFVSRFELSDTLTNFHDLSCYIAAYDRMHAISSTFSIDLEYTHDKVKLNDSISSIFKFIELKTTLC